MAIHDLATILSSPVPEAEAPAETDWGKLGFGFGTSMAPQGTPPFFDPDSHQAQPLGGHEGHGDHAGGMDPRAEAAWAKLTGMFPHLTTSSAFRTLAQNTAAGGAKNSTHMKGLARDVPFGDMNQAMLENVLTAALPIFPGTGIYGNSFHFDVGPRRHWGPSYHKESTPQWALDVMRREGY